MATQVQFRGGTTTEHASFNGAAREVTVDTTKQTLVVQDGSTNGGFPLLGEKNADNITLNLGTGNDLQLYHNGANSRIVNTHAGQFSIGSDITAFTNAAISEDLAKFTANGAAELYWDGSKKLETLSTGVSISGNLDADQIDVGDAQEIRLGNSADMKIVHDGSNSYLKTTTGHMFHDSQYNQYFRNQDGSETRAIFVANGAVELYWDNSKRIETTQYGAKISSNLSAGYLEVSTSASSGDGHIEIIGGDGGAAVFSMTSDGGDNDTDKFRMQVDDGGPFYLKNKYSGSWENNIMCAGNGRVELYYDGGKKFETISNGVKINDVIQLYHDGSHSYLKNATGIQFINGNSIYMRTEDSSEDYFRATQNGAVELYYDGTKKFETSSDGTTTTGNATFAGTIAPSATDTYSLGYSSQRWENIYMNNDMFIKDTGRICFGDSNDLQLHHDGSNSYITDAGTGFLIIKSSETQIQNDGGEDQAKFISNGAVELYYDNVLAFKTGSNGNYSHKHCDPSAADTFNLGHNYRWKTLYTNNAVDVSSDRNTKNTIIDSDLGLSFINQLRPVSFKKNNQGDSIHYGLIAQEVEDVIINTGKSLEEFSAISKPADKTMGLAYSEFISPLIKAVQELTTKVETLEAKVAALEAG